MAKTRPMSLDFARWYADAFMEEGPKRELRWKGVLDAGRNADHVAVEVLVRLAFQTAVPASGRKTETLTEVHQRVVKALSGGDATFDPNQSARELQLLAATALIELFGTLPDAALAVTTASLGGARRLELPMDLVELAEKALVTLSGRQHARAGGDEMKLASPKIEFAVAPEILGSMDPAQWKVQFDKLHDATTATLEHLVESQNEVVDMLHRRISLDEEELQMLWWLLGGHSKTIDLPFADIAPDQRPLVLGQELADMTFVSPGPASIRALLVRASVGNDALSLQEAVNAVEAGWAGTQSSSKNVSPATTPIHFALEQRSELASTETWQAAWTALTGFPADVSLPAARLADLFYREHLFLHVGA